MLVKMWCHTCGWGQLILPKNLKMDFTVGSGASPTTFCLNYLSKLKFFCQCRTGKSIIIPTRFLKLKKKVAGACFFPKWNFDQIIPLEQTLTQSTVKISVRDPGMSHISDPVTQSASHPALHFCTWDPPKRQPNPRQPPSTSTTQLELIRPTNSRALSTCPTDLCGR